MPGATRRMYPARTNSRWLGSSASAGSSRRVRRNRVDMRRAGVDTGSPLVRVTTGPGTGAPDTVRISAGGRRTHANCLNVMLLPHRSHQDRGEAPDIGEPDPRIGGPGRRVEVIDIERDHRRDLGPDLLDNRGHGGRSESLATPCLLYTSPS